LTLTRFSKTYLLNLTKFLYFYLLNLTKIIVIFYDSDNYGKIKNNAKKIIKNV